MNPKFERRLKFAIGLQAGPAALIPDRQKVE
jgi:hypothetical protein